jgi:hypothetical protein
MPDRAGEWTAMAERANGRGGGRRACRGRGDDGQVGVGLGLAVVAIATVAVLLVGSLGRTVNDRWRARTAADAAALAAVAGGRPAAERLAADNGGVLEAFSTLGAAVEATVRVGTARATSRAAPMSVAPPPVRPAAGAPRQPRRGPAAGPELARLAVVGAARVPPPARGYSSVG